MAACTVNRETLPARKVCSAPNWGIQFHRLPDQARAGYLMDARDVGALGFTIGRSISRNARVVLQSNSACAVLRRGTLVALVYPA